MLVWNVSTNVDVTVVIFVLVRLTGACSNHDVAARLDGALERKLQILSPARKTECRPKPPLRLPMGAIQAAALAVLTEADGALNPPEVRSRVESRLRVAVSQDTITSCLSVTCRSSHSPIERVGRGLYRVDD